MGPEMILLPTLDEDREFLRPDMLVHATQPAGLRPNPDSSTSPQLPSGSQAAGLSAPHSSPLGARCQETSPSALRSMESTLGPPRHQEVTAKGAGQRTARRSPSRLGRRALLPGRQASLCPDVHPGGFVEKTRPPLSFLSTSVSPLLLL